MVKYRIWFTLTVACCVIVGSGGADDYDTEYSTNDEVIYDDFTDSTTQAGEKIYNENYNSDSDKELSFRQLNETVTTEGTTIETDATTEDSVITTIITTTSTTTAPATEVVPSSSEDLSHVSQGSSGDDLTTMPSNQQDEEDIVTDSSLTWLNNIYNPHGWNMTPPGNVFGECRRQLMEYAAALLNGTTWAAKVTDASGHYSSQFFFGNDFWLGSHALCEELQNPSINPIVPPFELRFHVARLSVNIKNAPRTVLLGLCLPRTCSSLDITRMLQSSSPVQGARSLRVLRVRAVPGPYRIIDDIKFHILGGVMAAMLLLMAVGTSYEMLLTRRTPPDTSVVCVSDAEAKRCLPSRILLAFSALTNGRRILQTSNAEDAITSIHGLRFLSLAWVILVHTYLEVFAIAENKTLRAVTERNLMFQTISNATFSVDSFFFISGLLLTYLYLRSLGSEKSPSGDGEHTTEARTSTPTLGSSTARFIMLVTYRLVRLTPAYLFVLGLVEVTTRWVHNNSVFEPNIIDQHTCDKYWWRNALYINSLFPRSEMCMLWSWYMANDTQFYVMGLILLLLGTKFFKAIVTTWGLFLVSSWCITAFISFHYQYLARIEEPFALFDELYDKPWTRVGPYLVGMATGWLLHHTNSRINMSPFVVLFGWVLSLFCLVGLVYGLLHLQLDVIWSAVYVSLGHTAWGLALAWIVIACGTGHGGFVNTLLSFRAMVPLSRLTYCAYLVHPVIMMGTSFQMDGPLHLHNTIVIILYMGNLVASYLVSFIISLALEAPLVQLLKMAMNGSKKKK
ncbi:nose resistant to fluoxetine protein 6 [Anabrus simplex]|uniref:nose resistant to fluoxetine protein 6 n=1 Tax=Anabrus simplex TaxID=316456 RepID=UPI0035A331EA